MDDKLKELYFAAPRQIQTLGINIYELKEYMSINGRQFNKCSNFILETESWEREEFEKYQTKMLIKIIKYAYKNVPYYHKLYKKNAIDVSTVKTIEDLEKLPIISKETIMRNYPELCSKTCNSYTTMHTSGTTGTPLKLRVSNNLNILYKSIAYRRDLWSGYKKNEWQGRFVGDTPIKDCTDKYLYRISYVNTRVIFPSYCLNINTFQRIFRDLAKLRIKYIHAYPSTAFLLAKYLEFKDEYYPLKALLYSSEPLHDYQRELIEKRFKCKVFGFYGQAERAVSATECEFGNYHLTAVDGIMEVTRDGLQLRDGECGSTVVTSLHNYAMPLIRYSLSDYTGYRRDECECGRTLPLCNNIETKHKEDYILTSDMRLISPSLITFPLKHAKNVLESQIIQEDLNRIIINLVPYNEFKEEDRIHLINSFKLLLGNNVEIDIKSMKAIPRTARYKKRFVINKLGGDYIEKAFNESNQA